MRAAEVLLELPPRTEEQQMLPAGTVVQALSLAHSGV